ncbi:uncharacterized protein TNCV_4241371 [Trichonephila clavipes]|nr:uncharacterized protein TNCV_4241371 [Trichonephila clavipes]
MVKKHPLFSPLRSCFRFAGKPPACRQERVGGCPSNAGSFRTYYPYGLNVIWKGESVLLTFKQKSEDSLYIPNFDKSINNSNNIGLARISRAKRRKRVTRDMSTLKNSVLELAVNFDDNYNTGLIKSFMFGMNKTEIKIMTDILSRYKFRNSHVSPNSVNRESSGTVFLLLRKFIGRPLSLGCENPEISYRAGRAV